MFARALERFFFKWDAGGSGCVLWLLSLQARLLSFNVTSSARRYV